MSFVFFAHTYSLNLVLCSGPMGNFGFYLIFGFFMMVPSMFVSSLEVWKLNDCFKLSHHQMTWPLPGERGEEVKFDWKISCSIIGVQYQDDVD